MPVRVAAAASKNAKPEASAALRDVEQEADELLGEELSCLWSSDDEAAKGAGSSSFSFDEDWSGNESCDAELLEADCRWEAAPSSAPFAAPPRPRDPVAAYLTALDDGQTPVDFFPPPQSMKG